METNTPQGRFGLGVNRLSPLKPPGEGVFDGKTSLTRVDKSSGSDLSYEYFQSIDEYELKRKAQLDGEGSVGGFSTELHAKFESVYSEHRDRTAAALTMRYKYKETLLASIQGAVLTDAFVSESNKLPKDFTAETATRFYHFYDLFGTDVATSEIECGSLQLRTLIDRSKISSSDHIKASVRAEYDIGWIGARRTGAVVGRRVPGA